MTKKLKQLLEQAERWPAAAQEELVQVGLEIATAQSDSYLATATELAGIDRGIEAASTGDFATDDEVDAFFTS